jgi:phosphotriesterase-related protein
MKRRNFIISSPLMITAAAGMVKADYAAKMDAAIMTVQGPVKPENLGSMLTHEHILVDFIGADKISADRYDSDEVFRVTLPYLKELKESGCRALAECTPAFLGRDPLLLARLSRASGLNLLTNTGFYGAANDKYIPPFAWEESADQLAARWIREWEQGIGDTGIRPGFIKIGVDSGSLSEIDSRIVRAAARTHRHTGLTIMSHTGPALPAFDQLKILREEGVDPSAWIWTHAQGADDLKDHYRAADAGAWIAFDGLSRKSFDRYADFLGVMKERNQLDQVLLSHDAGWYSPGETGGGDFRGFTLLYREFLPLLREKGMTDEDIFQVMVENPAAAFTVKPRLG